MPREAGAGHWRDWHREHGCHLDPDHRGGNQKSTAEDLRTSERMPSVMSDDSTKKSGLTFLEALKSGRPMRRMSQLNSGSPWLFLGTASSAPLASPTWRRIDTGETAALARWDYTAGDWEVMP
jgi:hypothetical protein